jgi:hypothetical protein
MTLNFCTRTATKIRRLGHPGKIARYYAGFFYILMLSVCGLLGLFVLVSAQIPAITGSGINAAGPRAADTAPASFGIHRP